MAVKAIAHSYWRTIQRGSRAFASVPASVQNDVRALARADVSSGALTPDEYSLYIGEPYEEPSAV